MLSLCLTNYNRYELLINSFSRVRADDRIKEIVISDDCSDPDLYDNLVNYFSGMPKVKLFRNEENIGMSRNKAKAIELATYPYCLIFDSDNILDTDYLDALFSFNWEPNRIFMPSAALPKFDFRQYEHLIFNKDNAKNHIGEPMFEVMLNTSNYVVPRDEYLKAYKYDPSIKESDTIYFSKLWLEAGNSFFVVPGMTYHHLVHENSGWLKNHAYNMVKADEIKEQIRRL